MRDLVIFDTCTLPEYYADVHKILALPREHVVTYDYSQRFMAEDVIPVLDRLPRDAKPRVLLAYIQPPSYCKGEGTKRETVLDADALVTLTRLASISAVRVVRNNESSRYYIDLKLHGYPLDPGGVIAQSIVGALRTKSAIPMKTYIAWCPDPRSDALFRSAEHDAAGFSSVVEALSRTQFAKDTFWRIQDISVRTKSVFPMYTKTARTIAPVTQRSELKTESVLRTVDQSSVTFLLQFHRGQEHGNDYRSRHIAVAGSPKSSADLVLTRFQARSFGQETVAISIPATSSLSRQEVRFQLRTEHHSSDEHRDYPYGPDLSIVVQYRKSIPRSLVAIIATCVSSALFAWASFVGNVTPGQPPTWIEVPLHYRVIAVTAGVLIALYAYYLWSDDLALDKVTKK